MEKLTDQEMVKVNGGSVLTGLPILIAAGVTLIAGIIDGILRPLKCN